MRLAVDHLAPVEETLLVPLWARARESDETTPILDDPRSRAICERLDYDFTPIESARASQVGCCVRGEHVDTWVRRFLREQPGATVVELGCGLNSRFERVDDGRVRWFDLDLPGVVALRRRFFADGARRTTLATCVLDPTWMDTVATAASGPTLFVTEGMLPYLAADDVRGLLRRLADRFPGAGLVFDAMTPLVLRHQRHHDAMRHFRARFTWSLKDAREVEGWDPRLRIEESVRFHDLMSGHARRLPRTLRVLCACLAALYPPFKRSYTVNLARFR